MPIDTENPKYKNTIRLAIVISDTPENQLRMATLIEQAEHVLQKAEGFTVIKCASEQLQFMGKPNEPETPPEEKTKA